MSEQTTIAKSDTINGSEVALASTVNGTFVQQAHQDLTEFTLFHDLPSELRLRVYDFMMLGRRMIYVHWRPTSIYRTSTQVPAILYLSREARYFLNTTRAVKTPLSFNTHIDYQRDFVYLDERASWEGCDDDTRSSLVCIGPKARDRLRYLVLGGFASEFLNILPGIADLSFCALTLLYDARHECEEEISKERSCKMAQAQNLDRVIVDINLGDDLRCGFDDTMKNRLLTSNGVSDSPMEKTRLSRAVLVTVITSLYGSKYIQQWR